MVETKVTKNRIKKKRRSMERLLYTLSYEMLNGSAEKQPPVRIFDLPNETLENIFSYLSKTELIHNIRCVCRRFKEVVMSPTLWKSIEVDSEVPTDTLITWIKFAKYLKHFDAQARDDGNLLAEEVSKSCKSLESFKLEYCWGSTNSYTLHSLPLCHLITRCSKLQNINFNQCRFKSCKFLRLWAKTNHRAIRKNFYYTGPMTIKQVKAIVCIDREAPNNRKTFCDASWFERFPKEDIIHGPVIEELCDDALIGNSVEMNIDLELQV